MKKVLFLIAIVLVALVITSCVTRHSLSDFDVVRPGQTEGDILKMLGKPSTQGYKDGLLVYVYNDVMASFWSDDYCVYEITFKDGVVVSYGQSSYQHSSDTYVYVNNGK